MTVATVIIPARNEERYLGRTLESVKNNVIRGIVEIIVVCDSCNDKTADVAKRFSGVKIYSVRARKPSVARNEGAKHATSDNYIFLDADTTISRRALVDILDELRRNRVGTLKVKPYPAKCFAKVLMFFKNLGFAMHLYPGSNGLIFCTKKVFNEAGGFDESLSRYEDGVFMHSALKYARYSFIRSSFAETSIRRFEVKGYFRVMFYWIKVWFKHLRGMGDDGEYEVVR
jgi:glycosyltransferase involved in cell wall biosynthesis